MDFERFSSRFRGVQAQVESLYLMWRTTKLHVYRNWGQRLLAAFYRMKTPCLDVDFFGRFRRFWGGFRGVFHGFWMLLDHCERFSPRLGRRFGFASLHNVNKPGQQRDDMPSFFMAETLKRLDLLRTPTVRTKKASKSI